MMIFRQGCCGSPAFSGMLLLSFTCVGANPPDSVWICWNVGPLATFRPAGAAPQGGHISFCLSFLLSQHLSPGKVHIMHIMVIIQNGLQHLQRKSQEVPLSAQHAVCVWLQGAACPLCVALLCAVLRMLQWVSSLANQMLPLWPSWAGHGQSGRWCAPCMIMNIWRCLLHLGWGACAYLQWEPKHPHMATWSIQMLHAKAIGGGLTGKCQSKGKALLRRIVPVKQPQAASPWIWGAQTSWDYQAQGSVLHLNVQGKRCNLQGSNLWACPECHYSNICCLKGCVKFKLQAWLQPAYHAWYWGCSVASAVDVSGDGLMCKTCKMASGWAAKHGCGRNWRQTASEEHEFTCLSLATPRAQAVQAAFGLPDIVQLLAGNLYCIRPVSLLMSSYMSLHNAAWRQCHCCQSRRIRTYTLLKNTMQGFMPWLHSAF